MHTNSVRSPGPPGQGNNRGPARRPDPPEVPAHYALSELSTPEANIFIWHDRPSRTALVRIIDGAGVLEAGKVEHGGTSSAIVRWNEGARKEFPLDWLDRQADRIKLRLAYIWGAI